MNILLLGKTGGIAHWPEDVVEDFRFAGHTVEVARTRDPRLNKAIERFLLSPAIGSPLAVRIVRVMRRFKPDLILAVGALDHFPRVIFEHLFHAPNRPPLLAWIGDQFNEHDARIADLFDLVAYTDTGFMKLHERFACRSVAAYVPLGASRALMTNPSRQTGRKPHLAFVAAPTPNRRELLTLVTHPIAIFGPGWQDARELAHHHRHNRRINAPELATIYANHMGVLNLRHGTHVINGLNQRHFAPFIHGTPVVSDAQPDIARCFDPGTEILVFEDAAELNAIQADLVRHPERGRAVATAGQRRVLAQHTYAHRLDEMAELVGVKKSGPSR